MIDLFWWNKNVCLVFEALFDVVHHFHSWQWMAGGEVISQLHFPQG
jgi:hypothetical protein